MNVSRLIMGVFAIGVAATFYVNALGYPQKAANIPQIYSVVVALLGAAMVGQEVFGIVRRRQVSADVAAASTQDDAALSEASASGQGGRSKHKPWKAILAFLLAALYLYSISMLGYLLATVAFMAVALAMVGHVTWRFAAVGIVLLVTVVCVVFIGFLGLPVPLLPPLLS